MLYDDLLKKPWKEIPEPMHERARRLAFDAGEHAAEQAIANHGSEILRFRSDTDLRDFFFSDLVKSEDFWDQLSELEENYWVALSEQPYPADPRIKAFGDAWLYFMENELAKDFPRLSPEKLHRRYFTGMRPTTPEERDNAGGNRRAKAVEDKPQIDEVLSNYLDIIIPEKHARRVPEVNGSTQGGAKSRTGTKPGTTSVNQCPKQADSSDS